MYSDFCLLERPERLSFIQNFCHFKTNPMFIKKSVILHDNMPVIVEKVKRKKVQSIRPSENQNLPSWSNFNLKTF